MSDAPHPIEIALTRRLWDLQAIRVSVDEPFELASGNRSPIYINCRQVISAPDFMRLFTSAARAILEDCAFDAIAGGATAGIPYASYLAADLNRPLLYVRKAAKGYGTDSLVEGVVGKGWRVLLVEDLITDGGSKIPFLDALESAGAKVGDALVLVDREQGGGRLLQGRGVTLRSLVSRTTAMNMGVEDGYINDEDRRAVEDYFNDPGGWHRRQGLVYREVG